MKEVNSLRDLRSIDWIIPLVACLAFALPTLGIFNYFFLDDFWLLYTSYLNSKSLIGLFKAAFSGRMSMAGEYRPLFYFFWGLVYRIWGMNPVGYQLMIPLLFSVIAIYLYKIGRLLKGRTVGLLASLSFLTFFPNFGSMWWIGGALAGVLVVSFLTIGIFNGILWLKNRKKKHLILCLIMALLASLSRESSLVFGPIIVAYALLCHSGNNRKRGFFLGLATGIIAIAVYLLAQLFPAIHVDTSKLFLSITLLSQLSKHYFRIYICFFSVPLLYLVTISFIKKWKYHIILLPLLLIILATHHPYKTFYPLFLVLIIMCFLFGRPQQRFAIAWLFIGLSYALIIKYPVHRYMLESSLGMSLFIGLSLEEYVSRFKTDFRWREFVGNLKGNLKGWKSRKMLKFLSSAMGMLTVVALFLVATYYIIRIDVINGRTRLRFYRAVGQQNKDVSLYIREHIPQEAIKFVISDFGLEHMALSYDYQIHCDSAVTGAKSNISPICSGAEIANRLSNNEEVYIIGPLNRLFEFIESHRFNLLPHSTEREDLRTILKIYDSDKIRVRVIREKDVAKIPNVSIDALLATTGEKPCYIIFELKGDELLRSLIILATPRIGNDLKRKDRITASYSKGGNSYLPVFRFSSNGSDEITPIMGNAICGTVFPHSKRVYLKFQFYKGGQLWLPVVIVNRDRIEGIPFTLSFSPETGTGESIVAAAHIEKTFGIDGIYPVGILEIKRIPEGN